MGRESSQVHLEVLKHSTRKELEPQVLAATLPGTVVNSDEWEAYARLAEHHRVRKAVCHKPGRREWAGDDDGDGIREVHNNTCEGICTGLRNFLRPFRGVNKEYLGQYVAIFEWAFNLKAVAVNFLCALLGTITPCAS